MSTTVTGRVVDGAAEGITGLTVLIRDESGLIGSDLGTGMAPCQCHAPAWTPAAH